MAATLRSLALAAAATATALTMAPLAAAQTTRDGWGLSIADNSGVRTLGTLFRQLEPKTFRFQVPYDADAYASEMTRARDIIARARALGVQQIVVTFNPRTGDNGSTGYYRPSADEWYGHVRAFIDRFDADVNAWGPANEPNAGMGWLSGTGPDGAVRLAAIYVKLRDDLRARGSRDVLLSPEFHDHLTTDGRLVVTAGDPRSSVRKYIDAYVAAGGGWGDVAGWHPYSGVKHLTKVSTDDFAAALPSGKSIWITEVGALQPADPTPTSDAEQNRAVNWMLNDPNGLAKHPRVTRIYYYHVQDSGAAWDSALQAIDGSPRPAWFTWCAAAHGDNAASQACRLDATPYLVSQSGRVDMVVRGFDGAIWHRSWTALTDWTPWASLGGSFVGDPSAISWSAGHLDVFARQADGAVFHKYLLNGVWSAWDRLGAWSVTSDPAPISLGNGHADVFARGTDGKLIHTYFTSSQWWPWEAIGATQITGRPSPISLGAGNLDVFARGTDGKLIHTWFSTTWQPWSAIEAWQIASDPAAIATGNGHADVFARGTDGKLIHTWFSTTWQPFEAIGAWQITGKPAPISVGPGQEEVFARGTDGRLIHTWLSGSWQPWGAIEAWRIDSDPVVASTGPTHMEVFARGRDGSVVHTWASGGVWSPFASLGGPGAP